MVFAIKPFKLTPFTSPLTAAMIYNAYVSEFFTRLLIKTQNEPAKVARRIVRNTRETHKRHIEAHQHIVKLRHDLQPPTISHRRWNPFTI